MNRQERKRIAQERREQAISAWGMEIDRHIAQFSPTFNKGFDFIEKIYNREVRKTPQLKSELGTVRNEVNIWYATKYSKVLKHEQLDLLTSTQIKFWRNLLLTIVGPWAMMMSDAEIQRFRDVFQSKINSIDKTL